MIYQALILMFITIRYGIDVFGTLFMSHNTNHTIAHKGRQDQTNFIEQNDTQNQHHNISRGEQLVRLQYRRNTRALPHLELRFKVLNVFVP